MTRYDTYGLVGERLPADLGVRAGLVSLHGQNGVEQEHALVAPLLQAATVFGAPLKLGNVVLELDVDVLERRRGWYSFWHAERQTMSLVIIMVRILTNNDHFNLQIHHFRSYFQIESNSFICYIINVGGIVGIEYKLLGRSDNAFGIFFLQELIDLSKILFLKLFGK